MERRLSSVFNTNGFEQQIRLTFTSGKAYHDFVAQIKNMADSEDVGAHEVKGVVSARQMIKVGDKEYYIEGEKQGISKSFVYDPSERRDVEFVYKSKKRKIVFNVFHKSFGAVVETLPGYPVHIRFVFRIEDKSAQLGFSIHPEKANDISSLVEAIETGFGYIETAFEISKNKRDVYLGIKNSLAFWERAKEVEDIFEIRFVPRERNDVDIYNLDRLFLLSKKGRYIKRIIKDLTQVLSEEEYEQLTDVTAGSVMALTWERNLEIELWKQSICLPCRYYIFNALLDSIDKGNNKEYILSFRTTDSHPLQVIEMTKDAAGNDPLDLDSAYKKVKKAKTFLEWTNNFYKK